MRNIIIDTDVGSDDAVAIMLAVNDPQVKVLGLTIVAGNVPLNLAMANALQTLEVCGKDIPVYVGADRPLVRKPVTAVNVHGQDGMGDSNLIHPTTKPQTKKAVDYILETVAANPQVDIVMLGPATNIALAILTDRKTMSKVHHIYSMGTSGLGAGNTTPVSEFNVFADAESYRILLDSGIPLTIAGFDMCIGQAAWNQDDIKEIRQSGPIGEFAVATNCKLLEYNLKKWHRTMIDLPDAVAMAAALDSQIIKGQQEVYAYCCIQPDRTYGQVIIYNPNETLAVKNDIPPLNAQLITQIDIERYKNLVAQRLRAA